MSDFGVVLDPTTLRFTRTLPASVEEVWAWLTESDKRGQWLASGDMDLMEGGGVTLRFLHADLSSVREPTPEAYKPYEEGLTTQGLITRCEPPHLLSYTWGGSAGRPAAARAPTGRMAARPAAKPSQTAPARLAGRDPGPFWSANAAWEAEYQRRIPRR